MKGDEAQAKLANGELLELSLFSVVNLGLPDFGIGEGCPLKCGKV